MLDSIFHMTLNYLESHFCLEKVNIFASFMQHYNVRHYIML